MGFQPLGAIVFAHQPLDQAARFFRLGAAAGKILQRGFDLFQLAHLLANILLSHQASAPAHQLITVPFRTQQTFQFCQPGGDIRAGQERRLAGHHRVAQKGHALFRQNHPHRAARRAGMVLQHQRVFVPMQDHRVAKGQVWDGPADGA